jgi:hypothetical protein
MLSSAPHQAVLFGATRRKSSQTNSNILRSTANVGAVGVQGKSPCCSSCKGAGCCAVGAGRMLVGTFPLLVDGAGLWMGGAGSSWLGAFPLLLDGHGS